MSAPAIWRSMLLAMATSLGACQPAPAPGPRHETPPGASGGTGPTTAAGGSGGTSAGTSSPGGSGGATAVPIDEPASGGSSGAGTGGNNGSGGQMAPADAAPVDAALGDDGPASASVCPAGRTLVWRLDFSHPGWNGGAAGVAEAIKAAGGTIETGSEHVSVINDPAHGNALHVRYPPGSGSNDCVNLKQCVTAGGIVFFMPMPDGGAIKSALLSYWVKFDPSFEWVKGGKLPGMCGHGCPIAGAKVAPDRFSLRFMWRPGGAGEVYSYLTSPPNPGYGLDMGVGSWHWKNDGAWHHIQQELVLNTGNNNDGSVRVWYDNPSTAAPDFQQKNLKYYDRTRYPDLGIDTLVFSTFHGGHERSWSPSKEVTTQFADFQLCR